MKRIKLKRSKYEKLRRTSRSIAIVMFHVILIGAIASINPIWGIPVLSELPPEPFLIPIACVIAVAPYLLCNKFFDKIFEIDSVSTDVASRRPRIGESSQAMKREG